MKLTLDIKKKCSFFWLRGIKNARIDKCCVKCFSGIKFNEVYEQTHFKDKAHVELNLVPDIRVKAYYLCGLSQGFRYDDNTHVAFVPDEENNIVWAKMLERAGCHVIYGLLGLKTHCKIALVVRKEEDGIKRYIHLGTGNYNDSTAKLYTDCGIMTCSERIGEDATAVFNMLSGYSEPARWHKLAVAPIWMRAKFYSLIDREIAHAKAGRSGRIVAKMNSICDQAMIAKLYEASAAGVKIDLIVRGICSLRVGIPGVSENINVSSIVGNFLEHSRIYYFYNDGQEEIFMGSADWMPRNLDRRVEIIFPVEDEDAKTRARHILEVNLADNKKAYYMDEKGDYNRIDKRGKKIVSAQETFVKEAMGKTESKNKGFSGRRFIPKSAPEGDDE